MKTTELKKGTKVVVLSTFFMEAFMGEIVSDGLVISKHGDACYEVRRFDDNFIYNIKRDGLCQVN